MTNEITHFATIITPEGHFDNSDGCTVAVRPPYNVFFRQAPKADNSANKNFAIAEEYGPFTSLVMEAISVDLCSTRSNSPLMDDSTPSQANNNTSPQEDVSIPFLPLRGTFDYANPMEWAVLSKDIEGWLVTEVDNRSQLWTWGCDAFWLTFVAAYPLFPRGKWPMWDPRVPLEGTFIQEWLGWSSDIDAMQLRGNHSLLTLLSVLWAKFNKHTALFYPFPLLAVDRL